MPDVPITTGDGGDMTRSVVTSEPVQSEETASTGASENYDEEFMAPETSNPIPRQRNAASVDDQRWGLTDNPLVIKEQASMELAPRAPAVSSQTIGLALVGVGLAGLAYVAIRK